MSQLVAFVKNFNRNEEGQDLLEYALLVALIALVALAAVAAAGNSVSGWSPDGGGSTGDQGSTWCKGRDQDGLA